MIHKRSTKTNPVPKNGLAHSMQVNEYGDLKHMNGSFDVRNQKMAAALKETSPDYVLSSSRLPGGRVHADSEEDEVEIDRND